MKELLMIMMSVILVDNFVLAKFLGICPFLGVSKKLDSAVGMGVAVTFVMVLATLVTWPIQILILDPNGIGYMQTIVFILVIAGLVQLVEMTMKKYMPPLYSALGVYLPLITTNCAVLGVCVLNITEGYGFVQSIFNSLGGGIGFLLAMVLFAGLRGRLENNKLVPEAFKGAPITLVTASILSLSFMGFSGMVDGIFA
ncbi:MAG TPA: electron transport complex subunit RsxA [Candidatus Eubacterium pullicola]|uniref:Ion-translocating oxidoreductase complex subunit A n=1 Tax=Gallibacter intestinalis TaxID=2779356 RepID=A0ABR9QZ32_9FIRM|nr:electron transport complex subunit RsxA [Gallibacter intestinalis]MBE5036101.1 electron transport complex subunit RsxA [Gallibacter intestinalis]HIW39767.1 electron transport complex subunit RsxA [Candidatus Eubacterium pullicola]